MSEAVQSPAWTFPSTFKASFNHWWSNSKEEGASAEEALVRRGLGSIPLVSEAEASSSQPGKRGVLRHYQLDGHKDPRYYLNALEVGNYTKSDNEHVQLILHGYGNALGFFWQNYGAFASIPNSRQYYLDWLGMGRSGRPAFPSIKQKGDSAEAVQARVSAAESFFLESLEQFREKVGAEQVTLIGHSIGGYLSTAYALKYPERVKKLILISPVGVPKSPYVSSSIQNEHDAKVNRKGRSTEDDLADAPAELGPAAAAPEAAGQKAPKGWWTYLWDANISPFSIIRASTFMGPSLISRYAARRFATFPSDTQQELFSYLYTISKDRGSGEYCLAHLLAPGAYARWPLSERMSALKVPVTFIYGDHDWMDEKGGYDVVKQLKNKPVTEDTKIQKAQSRVIVNEHSGHWVHLENPAGFDRIITKELKEAAAL